MADTPKNPHRDFDEWMGRQLIKQQLSARHDTWEEGRIAGLAECAETHFKPDWTIGAQAIKDAADEASHARDAVVDALVEACEEMTLWLYAYGDHCSSREYAKVKALYQKGYDALAKNQ